MKKYFSKKVQAMALAASASLASVGVNADILTDSQTAIAAAGADGLTVGGYVVSAVAGLIVIGLILKMVGKI